MRQRGELGVGLIESARIAPAPEREVLRVQIRLLREPDDRRKIVLDSDSKEVTFLGPRQALEEMKRGKVTAHVDVSELTKDSPRRSLPLEFEALPAGVRVDGEPHALAEVVE